MNQHSSKPIHSFVIKAANEKLAINELVLLLWVIKGKVASKLFPAHCIERHAESTYNAGKLGFWIIEGSRLWQYVVLRVEKFTFNLMWNDKRRLLSYHNVATLFLKVIPYLFPQPSLFTKQKNSQVLPTMQNVINKMLWWIMRTV